MDRARPRCANHCGRYRNQQPRRDPGRAGRGQPRAGAQRRLLHPARPWRQRYVRRAPRAARPLRSARRAQATARKRCGAESLSERQIRSQRVGQIRYRGRADRRHHDRQLRARCRSLGTRDRRRPWHGRAGRTPPRSQMPDLQGAVRHRQEGDPLRRGPARQGDAICRRGCRRYLAAPPPAQAAARGGRRDAGLRTGRPAADPGGRAHGAPRDQGRSCTVGPPLGRVRRRDRATRGRDPHAGGARIRRRQPQAAGRRIVRRNGSSRRAQGQKRAIFDRSGGA